MKAHLIIIILAIITYIFSVWYIDPTEKIMQMHKEKQDRIEQILKGE